MGLEEKQLTYIFSLFYSSSNQSCHQCFFVQVHSMPLIVFITFGSANSEAALRMFQ